MMGNFDTNNLTEELQPRCFWLQLVKDGAYCCDGNKEHRIAK